MKKIKEFFSRLQTNNSGESIVVDEEKFKKSSSEIMNENIRRYNKLLEEIEQIRREIKLLIPAFEKTAKEFIMFVSIPKEREEDSDDSASAKTKNPYANDFMLRRNEFEEKTRNFRQVFEKVSALRQSEIGKYFEAKRLINNNSIIIGEKTHEIEINAPDKEK